MDPPPCQFRDCNNLSLYGQYYCLIHRPGIQMGPKDITLIQVEKRTPLKSAAVGLSTRTSLNVPLLSVGVMIPDPDKYKIPLGWPSPAPPEKIGVELIVEPEEQAFQF